MNVDICLINRADVRQTYYLKNYTYNDSTVVAPDIQKKQLMYFGNRVTLTITNQWAQSYINNLYLFYRFFGYQEVLFDTNHATNYFTDSTLLVYPIKLTPSTAKFNQIYHTLATCSNGASLYKGGLLMQNVYYIANIAPRFVKLNDLDITAAVNTPIATASLCGIIDENQMNYYLHPNTTGTGSPVSYVVPFKLTYLPHFAL